MMLQKIQKIIRAGSTFRWTLAGIVIGAGIFGLAYWNKLKPEAPSAFLTPFRPAPAFALPDLHGKIHDLRQMEGSAILVHFWASWCAPCLEEIPQWVELASSFKNQKLRFIAVSLDEKWEDAQKVLPDQKLPGNMLSLLDGGGKVAERYGSFQFPETYLLSRDHQILFKWVGPQDWNSAEIRRLLSSLGQDPVSSSAPSPSPKP